MTSSPELTSDKAISSEPTEGEDKITTMSTSASDALPSSSAKPLNVVRFLYQIS